MKAIVLILFIVSTAYSQIYMVELSKSDKQDTLYQFLSKDNGITDEKFTVGFEPDGIMQFYTSKESFWFETKVYPGYIIKMLIKRGKKMESN